MFLAISVPGISNLFTCSALNDLNLYMKYAAEAGPSSYIYCVVYFGTDIITCSRSVLCLLPLLHLMVNWNAPWLMSISIF